MGNSKYIKRKIKELEDDENAVMKSMSTSVFKYSLGLLPLAGIGFVLGKYFLMYKAVGTLSVISAALISSARMDYKSNNSILSQIDEQKKHLIKVHKNGIKSTKELDRKRLEKIKELEREQDLINEQGKKAGVLGALTAITTVGGSIGIMLNPLIGGAVSAVSLIAANNLFNKDLSDEKKYNVLETRICNLRNDIELGPVYGYNPVSKQQNYSNPKEQRKPQERTKESKICQALEKQVDDYVEFLTKQKYNNKTKTKVK